MAALGLAAKASRAGLGLRPLRRIMRESAIADVREGGRGIFGSDAAGVLGEGAVFDPEQTVFDLPMGAGEVEEPGGVGGCLGQAGDGVDDWRWQRVGKSRMRSMRQIRRSPGQSWSRRAGKGRTAIRRISMRPCSLSMVSARSRSGGSSFLSTVPGKAATREGGIVAEGVGDLGLELGLVGFDE